MLEIKNISKYFGSKQVLNDISFNISKGKVFGVIGPNGAGKTTTLRIILGILPSSSGKIIIDGEQNKPNFHNLTGYLPEERGLYPKSTVTKILLYFAQLKGVSYSTALKKIDYWLDRLNLLEYKKYHVEELSKGNQQKIQFISAILHDPEILILDEPFSGFDPVNQTIFREIIDEMKANKYIILSTHLMDLAESLCDDLFLINKGQEVISGKLDTILNDNANQFQISYSNLLDGAENFLNQYNILERSKDFIKIDIGNKSKSDFFRSASDVINLTEVVRIKPTLHKLFLDKIESSTK